MTKTIEDYAYRVELSVPFGEGLDRATNALKDEGFGVLTEIDVKETLKQKLGAEFRRYKILGACNPPLAHRALQSELEIGLLLPCNVIVYETDNGCTIGIVDPISMLGVVDNPKLKPIADEARERLVRVVQALRV